MEQHEKTETLLKALAGKTRLPILESIGTGISNPGEIAKKLNRHRSTIEKHLRVLLKARMVEKVSSLTPAGQLSIRYKITDNANELLVALQRAVKEF
jgi:predicted transcriptional regulator